MIVQVTSSGVVLLDADRYDRLHVSTDRVSDLDVSLRAAGAGYADDRGAVLSTAWLTDTVRTSAATVAPWEQQLRDMIARAAESGWVTDDGSGLRAHVERPG